MVSSRANPSYWLSSTDGPAYPPLTGDLTVDAVVVGGGITGLTTALLLQDAGLQVALLEGDRLCANASGFTTAKVTSLHSLTYAGLISGHGEEKARQYADANQAAIEHLVDLGIECDIERRDAYTYTTDPSQVSSIEDEVRAATSLGLPASFETTTDLPYEVAGAVRFREQVSFHPRRFCLGVAERFVSLGGRIHESTRVDSVEDGSVVIGGGSVTAEHVVLATLLPIDDAGAFFAKASPHRSYAMAVRVGGDLPQGMYLGIDSPTRSVRPLRFDDGSYGLVLGGNGHKVGEGDSEAAYADLERWGRETFDVQEVVARWSAQDYAPVDDVPFIGRSPRRDHVYVATAFKKWGMTHSQVAAMLLRDLITGRSNPWAEVFDATRAAVTTDALKVNAHVARRLIGDKLGSLFRPHADSLAPGEARIVDLDGDKVAAWRDEGGALHAVSARCTHLGCDVHWNPAERSWDCPCHGSRFDCDGLVLEGPATTPLEPVSVDVRTER